MHLHIYQLFSGLLSRHRKILRKFQQTLIASVQNSRSANVFATASKRKMAEHRNGGDGSEDSTESESWRGCSMQEIHRNLNEFELDHLPPVRVAENHTILYHCPIRNIPDNCPPRPIKASMKWDAMHVRLPCSTESRYPVTNADGSSSIESRWDMIKHFLQQPIKCSQDLQKAIFSYNSKYEKQWNFRALHELFEEDLDESETRVFFEDLLPRIIRLALQLPHLIKAPIPLLKQGQTHSLTLSQQQISCLLANAFLCTFPRRNTLKRKSEYSTFPDINFNRLFQSSGQAVLEKIKCICHYFRRVCPTESDVITANVPSGVVTFTRRSLNQSDLPDWSNCIVPIGITPLHIASDGTIEDQGLGLLQVDFANKFLGGGVLGAGCVQEEIRFVICPELIVSKLFTECLRPTEALVMSGCERYSNYSGYASSFKWDGDHEDFIPRDSSRRRMTHIVAIDALLFRENHHQYREELLLRELNKAYTGFLHELETPAPGIASGNWGCGAFGGDARLKALIQLMVCTVTKRPLAYFTFGDTELRDDLHKMHTFFIENNVRVCDLWNVLRDFKAKPKPLYEFIYKNLGKSKFGIKLSKLVPNFFPNNHSKSHHTMETENTINAASSSQCTTTIKTSPDVFESASDTDSTPDTPVNIESASRSTNKTETRIAMSDDSESDEYILAATTEYELSTKTETVSTESNSLRTPQKQTAMRQRTLLEMLDQCYTEDQSGPATKRHCTKEASNQS